MVHLLPGCFETGPIVVCSSLDGLGERYARYVSLALYPC
jgi:hypothetical protein